MPKQITNLNIGRTSVIHYSILPHEGYDYNSRFYLDSQNRVMSDERYDVGHRGDLSISANDIIVNGIVICPSRRIYQKDIDLGDKKIYIPPLKTGDVYIEQAPVSHITFTATESLIGVRRRVIIQPYFDNVAYGKFDTNTHWEVEVPNPNNIYFDISAKSENTKALYTASVLQYKARWTYNSYPTYATALQNMQYGALRLNPHVWFFHSMGDTRSYDCFEGYEWIEDEWLLPFASEDEYNAAYAVLYQWDRDTINIINEFG